MKRNFVIGQQYKTESGKIIVVNELYTTPDLSGSIDMIVLQTTINLIPWESHITIEEANEFLDSKKAILLNPAPETNAFEYVATLEEIKSQLLQMLEADMSESVPFEYPENIQRTIDYINEKINEAAQLN